LKVQLSNELNAMLSEHAQADYPNECCGLLVGSIQSDIVKITEVHPSKNLTSGNPAKSFEVDPKLRFDVMREAQSRNDGVDIIGHYHSHPDGPAAPSAKDLSMAYEPNMVWLICRVAPNEEVTIGAFQPCSDRSAFNTLELVIN